MVYNATFNNILAISWRSVLLAEETGEFGENHRPVANHWQTYIFHIKLNIFSVWSQYMSDFDKKKIYQNVVALYKFIN